MKTLLKFTFGLLMILALSVAVSETYNLPAQEVAITLFAATTVLGVVRFIVMVRKPGFAKPAGLAYAVTVENWEDFIASNLFKAYEWLTRAKDRSSRVLGGAVVHIPQAGSVVGTQRNRAVYPVPLVKRSDNDITYVIDEISSDATHIKDAETVELSYDKINDVFGDHTNKLGQDCAKNALYRWFSGLNAANIVRTTGAAVASYLTGSTGNRKKGMVADIKSGKTIMNNQTKRESGKRIALMTEDFYNQLKGDGAIDTMEKHLNEGAVFKDGDLVRICGYDIIRTDVIPRFTNATPPVAKDPLDPSVVNAASDNDACLLIDLDFVHIAKGDIKFFETIGDALLQGDAYSALVRIGASRERSDQAGVVAIVQEP